MRENLRKQRNYKGYSQKEVAKKICKSRSTYTMYETGAIMPPYSTVLKLKILFDYYDDDLFENTE